MHLAATEHLTDTKHAHPPSSRNTAKERRPHGRSSKNGVVSFLLVVQPGLVAADGLARLPDGFEVATRRHVIVVEWAPEEGCSGTRPSPDSGRTTESVCEGQLSTKTTQDGGLPTIWAAARLLARAECAGPDGGG